jgi:16S rRNA (cytidine1402-2'-O)-methyltransferase
VSGSLVLVATPIGNLGDITRRAIDTLTNADVIYCEDTRHTRQLLSALEIPASGRLIALHEHNEASLVDEVVARVSEGAQVALVSDAGTPGVSDPGARIVAAVAAAGLVVTSAPGPSAVISALTISGLPTDRFTMEGFAPRRPGDRQRLFDTWLREPRTIILFESPQRLAVTLQDLAAILGPRRAVVAREMTKLHEEVVRGTLVDLAAKYRDVEVRGEVVIVIEGAADVPAADDDTLRVAVEHELRAGATVRDAAEQVADALGASRRRVYELALDIKRGVAD